MPSLTAHAVGPAIVPVQVRDLHMVFPLRNGRPIHALRGVTLDVERGAVLGLLGPNGCGKTTLISCLLGLLLPQAGEVRIEGRPIVGHAQVPSAQRPFGVLLEDTRLPPFLTVAEALQTVASLRGFSGRELRGEVDRVVVLCAIRELLLQRVGALSKGQARRAGLAAALLGDPPLLILDEPSSGLDVASRVEFEAVLRDLHDGRRTVIVASHFLGDVQNTCTHVAIMKHGRVVAAAPTSELLIAGGCDGAAASDIHVDAAAAELVAGAGLSTRPSRYSGLVHVVSQLDDAAVLERLLASSVTPRRMEPRANLLSVYLELTASGEVE